MLLLTELFAFGCGVFGLAYVGLRDMSLRIPLSGWAAYYTASSGLVRSGVGYWSAALLLLNYGMPASVQYAGFHTLLYRNLP